MAKAYVLIGRFSWLLGNYAEAKTATEKAFGIAEHAGEDGKDLIATISIGQASGNRARGEFEKAFDLYQQAVDLFRERGHYYLADALLLQAVTATSLKRFDIANSLLAESLNISQNQGDDHWVAYVFASKGDLFVCQQDFSIAQRYYNRSLEIHREYNAKVDIASIHNKLAITHLFQGNLSKAHNLLVNSIEIQRSVNNPRNLAESLFGFGVLAAVTKQPVAAIRLFSFIIQLVGNEFFYAFPAEEVIFQQLMDELRKETLPKDFSQAQKSGEVLSMETAIELALSLSSGEESLSGSKGLTPRQEEIAGLIAEGKTNGEIATQLVISKRTVEKHIANILMRLNFSHRAEIVRWAIENSLVDNASHS